jgi:sialate O-acetylesterase
LIASGWLSLTFDDALPEHLDNALSALDAAGLCGTFYVPLSAPAWIHRREEWQAAAARGHELGNHTIFHPADARKDWVRPGNAIDHYSLDRMRLELEVANQQLQAVDGRTERTFAYPCSNSCVGHQGWVRRSLWRMRLDRTRIAGWVDRYGLDFGTTRDSYQPIVAELFAAGRGGGLQPDDPVPSTSRFSRTSLPSVSVEDWSFPQLREYVTRGVAAGTWVILQFHGIGGGHHQNLDREVFREFVAWLGTVHHERVLTVVTGAKRLWPVIGSSGLTEKTS